MKLKLPRPLLIYTVAIGTVIGIPLTLFVISYLNGPEKELYLIPANFQRGFRVVYGQECGINSVYEKGRRVLQIPNDGVLLIKQPFKAGFIDNEYYLLDKYGNRKRMYEVLEFKEVKLKVPGVLLSSTGATSGLMPNGNSSSESPLSIRYADFYVFNTETLPIDERAAFLQEQKIDSLMTVKVENCRKMLSKATK